MPVSELASASVEFYFYFLFFCLIFFIFSKIFTLRAGTPSWDDHAPVRLGRLVSTAIINKCVRTDTRSKPLYPLSLAQWISG